MLSDVLIKAHRLFQDSSAPAETLSSRVSHERKCSPQQRALQSRAGVRVDEPQPPSSSSRPVLQSSSRFSLSSVVSPLNMSNDVVISVSLHLSMSDGKQEGGVRVAVTDEGKWVWPTEDEERGRAGWMLG